ncbi:MAG: hypothetical protein OEW49_03925 [Nitrosopumilus sp.]|nr:hypothetical protein [Nitrosopumilus sp.]
MSDKLEHLHNFFMTEATSKNEGMQAGYKVALNSLENIYMKKFGKTDLIFDIKKFDF